MSETIVMRKRINGYRHFVRVTEGHIDHVLDRANVLELIASGKLRRGKEMRDGRLRIVYRMVEWTVN